MAEQKSISGEPNGIGGVDGIYKVAKECPMRRVLAIREHGLVVEATRAFEVGSAMMLGCHVERTGETIGSGSGRCGFISAEVIVVDSREIAPGGEARHQVTVLFSEISSEDREILLALPNADGIRLSRSQTQAGGVVPRAGLAIPPPEVFFSGQPAQGASATSLRLLAKMHNKNGEGNPGSIDDSGVGGAGQTGCSLN